MSASVGSIRSARNGKRTKSYKLGTDPYCGGPVFRTHAPGYNRHGDTASCDRCGMFASIYWWHYLGMRGLA